MSRLERDKDLACHGSGCWAPDPFPASSSMDVRRRAGRAGPRKPSRTRGSSMRRGGVRASLTHQVSLNWKTG